MSLFDELLAATGLAGAFPGGLCSRSETTSTRWHTQPLRGNLGCYRHPCHAVAFLGALRR